MFLDGHEGDTAMEIVVIGSTAARNEKQKKGLTRHYPPNGTFVEKRHHPSDRRQGVRDGVAVRFSFQHERRSSPDRRKSQAD